MLKLSVWIHLVVAMFWIGGMLFLTFIIGPFLKGVESAEERSRIYQIVGTRFRFFGWISIILLLITGPLNFYFMGIRFKDILSAPFYNSGYGKALIIKLLLVAVIVLSSLMHDFVMGPLSRDSQRLSTISRYIGRANLIIALLIVLCGVFLRFGGI